MGDFLDFKQLALARKRQRAKDYIDSDIPMSVEHEEYLLAEELATKRERQLESAPVPRTDNGDPPERAEHSYANKGKARANRTTSEPGAWTAPTRGKGSQPNEQRHKNREHSLKMNEIETGIFFSSDKRWEGKALLDSGVIDNWISARVVEQEDLRAEWEDGEYKWLSFDNRPVKSLGSITGRWPFDNITHECAFRIAEEDSPFDVIFGCRSLMKRGWVSFEGKGQLERLAPLVERSKVKKGQPRAPPSHAKTT
jgi:hypothetical protein